MYVYQLLEISHSFLTVKLHIVRIFLTHITIIFQIKYIYTYCIQYLDYSSNMLYKI